MPVDNKHPEYTTMAPVWKLMRDTVAGQRAVHRAAETHLPRLHKEPDDKYAARLARAGFFNATGRTVQGLKGMLFRKAPHVKVSPVATPMLEDVTKRGVSFVTFAQQVADEALVLGRTGVLVDYPRGSTARMTIAQVEALNLRPHAALYKAEAILDWDETWINNKTVLSRVTLAESAAVPGPDEFTRKSEPRWRVLDLAPAPVAAEGAAAPMAYRVREFRKDATGKDELLPGSPYFPEMNGAYMTEIPFQFFGVDDTTPSVSKPPLEDLANVNISHYHTTADLEHGAHKTALPQPWIAGLNAKIDENGNPVDATFYMGGGDAWSFPSPDTEVGMLEFTGAGLVALENRLAAKEAHMAVLGARMLESQKRAVESAETAGIHRGGEQSALASQADTLSEGFVRLLGWFDTWAGGAGAVECAVNKEFFPLDATPEQITAWVAAWQQGALSKDALFEKFQKGGVVSDARKFEDEEAKIENAAPTLLAVGAAAPEPKPGDGG